ncbi:MAG: serine/threonine protein kinase, partial [Methanosarcinales archaeon]|nr:serine/threonine protein kinase [Methanosarcinales archaeon]
TTPTTPTTTIMPTAQSVFPQELGNQYHDPEFIGMGGFARAFRAKRTTDGRIVAVKIPISLDKNRKAFLREINLWKWLKHENIASLHAANVLPIPHLEIEYAGHGSLDQIEVPVKLKTALAIVLGIADGLAYAHAQGVTHRDLKPAKILVTEDNTPKISDWGLSRIMAESETSRVHGFTPLYGAPEQVAPGEFGEPDERTDIYQLGLIFYWLLTGRTPYGGGDLVEVTTAIAKELPEPPSKINQEASVVDSIILKCITKRKEDRYQSVRELREELTSVSSMPSVSSASHIPSPEIYWF